LNVSTTSKEIQNYTVVMFHLQVNNCN